jgi:hypothetical protein
MTFHARSFNGFGFWHCNEGYSDGRLLAGPQINMAKRPAAKLCSERNAFSEADTDRKMLV